MMKKLLVCLMVVSLAVGLSVSTASAQYPIISTGGLVRYLDAMKDQIDSINVMHDTLAIQAGEAFDSTGAFLGDIRVWIGNAETFIEGSDDVFLAVDQALDTVVVYIEGVDQALDTTAVHFADIDQVLDTLAVYLNAIDVILDTLPVYAAGVDQALDTLVAYDILVDQVLDTTAVYLNAVDVILDTLPAYTAGVDQALDTVYVYLTASDQALDTLAAYMASIKLTVDSLVAKFNDHLGADSTHFYANADSIAAGKGTGIGVSGDASGTAQNDTVPVAAALAAYAWVVPVLNWVDPDTLGIVATTDLAWANPSPAWVDPDTLGVVATTNYAWVNPAYAWANPAWNWVDPDTAAVFDDITDFIGTAGAVAKVAAKGTAAAIAVTDVSELPVIK